MSILHRRFLLFFFFCTILLRLFLSSDRDILALNQPYDDYLFVLTARNWIWGGSYNQLTFAQLPLYSMWLKCVSLVGIPARLAIDLAWLLACTYLGIAVARFCKSLWPAVLLFLFLTFHPFTIAWFDRALSESLMTVLSALALAGFIEIWNLSAMAMPPARRRTLAIWVASLAFAGAFHLRKEGAVLLPPIMLLAVWSCFQRDKWWFGSRRFYLGYPIIVYPLIATLALGTFLAGANYLRWGVFARYELNAPGFVKAVNSLNAIEPGAITPKYVTVTALTRAKAYEVSPTFRELRPFLDGASGQEVAKATAVFTPSVQGEIANGWFYWVLRDAAASAGWHRSAVLAEKKYAEVAEELERSFADGRLTKRRVLMSFIEPNWRKWLPDFPYAFIAENRQVIDLRATNLQLDLPENAKPAQVDDYILIVGRRRSPPPRLVVLGGWLILPQGSSISFGAAGQTFAWQSLSGPARPDVPGGLPFLLNSLAGERPTELHVRDPDGRLGRVRLEGLKPGMVAAIEGLPEAKLGVDQITSQTAKFRANGLLYPALQFWSYFGFVLAAAGLLSFLFFGRREGANLGAAGLITVLALTAILSRTSVFALLEVTSWKALEQPRYLFPLLPFVAVFGVLGLWMLSIRLIDAVKRR